jgi:hypothetical protein
MLGALLMIAWLMLGSVLRRRSVWIVPNLFATTFYGPEAYGGLLRRSSWAGIALLLAVYSVGGIVWGVFWGDRRRPLLVLFGAITGFAVYLISFDLIWKHLDPLIPLYAPSGQMQIAHMLWGMLLARSPEYAGRIARATADVSAGVQEAAARRESVSVVRELSNSGE